MKLYIAGPENDGQGAYYLISEKGECLASHFCSNNSFAKGDLEGRRPERQKKWKEKFGNYDILFLGEDDMTMEKIRELNEQFTKDNEGSD